MDELYTPIDIVLDSADSSTGDTDQPSFTFSPALEDVVGYTCFYANVPFTYNVVDGLNNQLFINIASTPYLIELTPGTYTPSTLIQELQAGFRDSGYTNYAQFTFFIANDTNQLTIYNNPGGGDIPFTIQVPGDRGCGELLGFRNGQSYASSNGTIRLNDDTLVAGAEYVEAPFSVNLSGPGQMYLRSPQLQGLINGAVRSGPTTADIVAFWPVNSNYLGNIIHQPAQPPIIPFTQTTISNISFYLTLGTRARYGSFPQSSQSFLSLKGQSYQIGLRFYKVNKLNVVNSGGSTRTISSNGPRQYNRRG